ncbi:MAG: tRNA pseudouridine55 synthase [Crocinitomicaceae bacterium]|jgi:tRNA pseudouridine55 synthase
MSIILWDKKYTETLAVTLERFRKENLEYAHSKITYAGRLDPMAEGLLLLLTDKDVHKKQKFLSLDKVYEVDFILGVSTDTYDVLGLITQNSLSVAINEECVQNIVNSFLKIQEQEYPPYSSKTVKGKALWEYTRAGITPNNIPVKNIVISKSDYIGCTNIKNLKNDILYSVDSVKGDFRQKDIISQWEKYFITHQNENIYTMRVQASSGTYMRSLVHSLGKELGIGATTLKIRRKKIGEYKLT